jgi:hypothetical protein
VPGSLRAPAQLLSTPAAPFPTRATTATTARHRVSPHDHEPLPRKWLVIAGIVLLAAIAIAIALKVSGGKAEPGKAKKHSEANLPASTQARTTLPAAAPLAPAVPATDTAPPAPPESAATGDRDNALKAAILDLQSAPTCTDRKTAIPKLVELGDPRAIAPLKAARYRMRGGVLGIGDSNTNACLKPDAEAAIKALGGSLK